MVMASEVACVAAILTDKMFLMIRLAVSRTRENVFINFCEKRVRAVSREAGMAERGDADNGSHSGTRFCVLTGQEEDLNLSTC